ncbi:MAG: hypothetical protein MUF54_23350 [Polyangiaceae bacterium]|jgi:hypothetical protein|nr:hypothetical protein [Polyangiaceae bacterium]
MGLGRIAQPGPQRVEQKVCADLVGQLLGQKRFYQLSPGVRDGSDQAQPDALLAHEPVEVLERSRMTVGLFGQPCLHVVGQALQLVKRLDQAQGVRFAHGLHGYPRLGVKPLPSVPGGSHHQPAIGKALHRLPPRVRGGLPGAEFVGRVRRGALLERLHVVRVEHKPGLGFAKLAHGLLKPVRRVAARVS